MFEEKSSHINNYFLQHEKNKKKEEESVVLQLQLEWGVGSGEWGVGSGTSKLSGTFKKTYPNVQQE